MARGCYITPLVLPNPLKQATMQGCGSCQFVPAPSKSQDLIGLDGCMLHALRTLQLSKYTRSTKIFAKMKISIACLIWTVHCPKWDGQKHCCLGIIKHQEALVSIKQC